MAVGFVFTTSQTAVAVPVALTGISVTVMPLPKVFEVVASGKPPAPEFSAASSAPPAIASAYELVKSLPPIGVGTGTGPTLPFNTLFTETNRRTPVGTLLKVALRRVPQSANPAVALPLLERPAAVRMKLDSA